MGGNTLRPQEDVAVGERDPEVILGESQEHGIVEQATLGVGDEDVFALTDLHRRQVAAGEQLGEAGGVRAGDLDLALDGDVAEDCLVDEIPEVLLRIPEVARDVHVVVRGEAGGTPAHGGVEIRRLADLGAEAEVGSVCLARLGRAGVGHGSQATAQREE